MADATAVLRCNFYWKIFNPFVPWKRLEATFYSRYPYLMPWTVTLVPILRNSIVNTYAFLLSIKGEKSGDLYDTIVAEKIEVNITLNSNKILDREERNYLFCGRNRYMYQILKNVRIWPPEQENRLMIINIKIKFPSENIENQEVNGFWGFYCDLMQLSRDMEGLLNRPTLYKDMRLITSNPNVWFAADSCILRARWTDFFKVHRGMGATVNTNMSRNILWDLLNYLYCGKFDFKTSPGSISYQTELFQVMDRYKMHHLYYNFVLKDSHQVRLTFNDHRVTHKTFLLTDRNCMPLDKPSFSWEDHRNTRVNSTFRIKFFLNSSLEASSFKYEMLSSCPSIFPADYAIYAQVNIELLHERTRPRFKRFITVHQRDFTIAANGTYKSGVCQFEGLHMQGFERFLAGENYCPERSVLVPLPNTHSVRLTLYLSTGERTVSIEPWALVYYDEMEMDKKRLHLLGIHLDELRREDDAKKDLRVECCTGNRRIPNETFLLHKAIFTSRVNEWWEVLEPPERRDTIPDAVKCNCRSDVFSRLIDYIYSAKLVPLPSIFKDPRAVLFVKLTRMEVADVRCQLELISSDGENELSP